MKGRAAIVLSDAREPHIELRKKERSLRLIPYYLIRMLSFKSLLLLSDFQLGYIGVED
jgi:hypothetical protein